MGIGKRLVVLLWVGYAIFAVGSKSYLKTTQDPSVEVFPFFAWSLFSRATATQSEYAVEVESLDGQQYSPPVDIMKLARTLALYADDSILVHKSMQALARAKTDERRLAFERSFLSGHDVSYRVVRYNFDPMDRWKTGERGEATVLGQYRAVKP
ncbi:MAG: hypothetical protein ACTSX7_01100 [Alphaproteobacteria bacterium]